MIDRHSVIEYINKHPRHTAWQMRLHFLQATRQLNNQSSVSISAIANQLNYILRDLEVTGKMPSPPATAEGAGTDAPIDRSTV
jgi:hypothetical protein